MEEKRNASLKKANISTVGEIYFLVDGKGKLIMPVYRYMLFLRLNGKSINTNLIYCKHLKLFFDWLSLMGLSYIEVVKENNLVLTNLANFKFWIKYPDYNERLIPIGGFEQKRSSSTTYRSFFFGTFSLKIFENVFSFFRESSSKNPPNKEFVRTSLYTLSSANPSSCTRKS